MAFNQFQWAWIYEWKIQLLSIVKIMKMNSLYMDVENHIAQN